MGLFNRTKHKAELFYKSAVDAYHKRAQELGYARDGIIQVPALKEFGMSVTAEELGNEIKQLTFERIIDFYFNAFINCIRWGILNGKEWDSAVKNGAQTFKGMVPAEDVYSLTDRIIKDELDLDVDGFNSFCQELFQCWVDLVSPYSQTKDDTIYMLEATRAAFQLGLSMILCGRGYSSQ